MQNISEQFAPRHSRKANIKPSQLILSDIHFSLRQLELAKEAYEKAILNNDYHDLEFSYKTMITWGGMVEGLKVALKYCLAQEAELSGRQISGDMAEFAEQVESMLNQEPI